MLVFAPKSVPTGKDLTCRKWSKKIVCPVLMIMFALRSRVCFTLRWLATHSLDISSGGLGVASHSRFGGGVSDWRLGGMAESGPCLLILMHVVVLFVGRAPLLHLVQAG